jgi:hypothetical protein
MSDSEKIKQREIIWLDRLKESINLHKNILFICGNNHLESFQDKLKNDERFHFDVKIVSMGWDSDPNKIDTYTFLSQDLV